MPQIGGACTHLGTIPSKSLRAAIYRLMDVNSAPVFRQLGVNLDVSFRDLRRSAQSVIDQQVGMRRSFYDRNDVEVLRGDGCFLDANRIMVEHEDGSTTIAHAKHFVIATGSRPYRPPEIDFSHPRVFDSDTILNLPETPKTMTIYGAGVVGCEYASMFRNLQVKLNLVNTRAKMLEFLDDEICDALAYHMRDTGVRMRNSETFEKLETFDDHVVMHLKSGKQLKSDIVLWANGRSGNTESLGLENVGLHTQSSRTTGSQRAFSDVTAAYLRRRRCDRRAVSGKRSVHSGTLRRSPSGRRRFRSVSDSGDSDGHLYQPRNQQRGQDRTELTDECVPYEVGHSMFKNLARAQIMGRPIGMLKLLFHRETLEILGVHCFGVNATEIIHIGQAIMAQPGTANSLLYFINTTFNYPTMAEAYRVAALNGYNRVK